MFLSITDLIIISMGYVSLLLWLFLFVKGNKYANMFETLDEKDFLLKEIYFVGYAVTEIFKFQYKSKKDRKLRQEVEILYGDKYADYYLRVVYSQKITISCTLFVLSFAVYGLTQEFAGWAVMVMFAGLAYYYFGTSTSKKIEERSNEMIGDFAEVVSQLALLTNAGMILKEAWEQTAYAGTTSIYKEMQKAVEDIRNGMAEIDAYHEFGKRCMVSEVKKFTSTIIQGVTKGNSELAMTLTDQSSEVWASRKQNARKQGEKAASKLLLPMCIMFVGILIMLIVPIFTNIGS